MLTVTSSLLTSSLSFQFTKLEEQQWKMKGFCHNTFHDRFVSCYPTPYDEAPVMKTYLLVDPHIRQEGNRLCQDYMSQILHSPSQHGTAKRTHPATQHGMPQSKAAGAPSNPPDSLKPFHTTTRKDTKKITQGKQFQTINRVIPNQHLQGIFRLNRTAGFH